MQITPDSFFRLIADNTRLRSMMLLIEHTELCVCELTHALCLSQPKISRHLAQLRDAGLVQDRREGLWIYYRLHPQLPDWIETVLQQTWKANSNTEIYAEDRKNLTDMPNRPGSACCA